MGMPHSLQTRIRGFAGSRFIPNRRFSNDMRPPKVPTVANTLDGTSGFLVDSVFGWLASGRHLDEPRLEAGKRLDEITLSSHHLVDILVGRISTAVAGF